MKIVWVPLPQARTESGRLSMSLYISPRLDATGVLGDVDRMVDWPDFVNGLDFEVVFNGTESVAADREPVDPKWWQKLFTPDTPLEAHTLPDHSQTLVHTFPVENVLGFIESTYKHVAENSATEFPSLGLLEGFLSEIRPATYLEEFGEAYEGELRQETENGLVRALHSGTPIAGLGSVASDFFRAHRFYRRKEQESTRDHDTAPERPEKPKPDFHRMLAFLADSPELLRLLGLIIDLEFDDPSPTPTGKVRIHLSDQDPNIDIRPSTNYQLTPTHFLTAPGPNGWLVEEGSLHLDFVGEIFDLYQVDVDGAALKVLDFSRTVQSAGDLPDLAAASPGEASLPSLRSAGFTVSHRSRAVHLVDALDGATALNTDVESDNAELHLEDVLRGYRLDVHDSESGEWHSLQWREGLHRFLGSDLSGPEDLGPVIDEGVVRANSATSSRIDQSDPSDPNKPGKPDLYLHEAMFGWDGWSLASPRPGKIIVEPGEGENDTSLDRETVKAGTDLPLESVYKPQIGTLPRLRYGARYRIRARAVDLAGNSLPFTPDDIDDRTTPERTYLRYEPISSPAVVRRHADTEGESLERLVIRSDRGISPAAYVADPGVVAASGGVYTEDSQRHIAPPKTSVQHAELHGRLDQAFGPGGDPQTVFKIAAKEEGTFLDALVVDPLTGDKDIDVSADIAFHPPGEGPADPKDLPRGAGLPEGVYVLRTGADLHLPYLPDPLVRGAAFYNLPGHPGSSMDVAYDVDPNDWWDVDPFRIRLIGVDKDSPAKSEVVGGVLQVTLPQAERIQSRMSSLIDKEGRETLAIWHLMSQQARDDLETAVAEGRMWMLTPFRHLEFVHAVQHPLTDPVINFTPSRNLGETFSGFTGTLESHAKSTGRLDVLAEWTEPLDSGAPGDLPVDGKDGRPVPKTKSAAAFGWDIAPDENEADVNIPSKRDSRHEFGDTRHRRVRYRPLATTRFREYFPAAILEDVTNIQSLGSEVELSIPNSARPAPPKVLYVVPTFSWDKQETTSGWSHTRKGGGLRVYLDRPWYSSGEGEIVGVVTLPPPKRVKPDLVISGHAIPVERFGGLMMRRTLTNAERDVLIASPPIWAYPFELASAVPYVTTVGKDPTWASKDPKPTLSYTDFPLRTDQSRGGLSIAEAPGATVAVAGHDVSYDDKRGLWYADIELPAGAAYFPFVRLALARFQPSSINHAHLSQVVLSDFIQLTADRTTTLSVANEVATVTVRGVGPHNVVAKFVHPIFGLEPSGPQLSHSRRLTAVLQKRDPGVQSDMAWTDAGDEVTLPLRPSRGQTQQWRGTIAVPPGPFPNGTHRILVREYEFFFTDFDPDEHGQPVSVIIPGQPAGFVRSRVVYVDTFEL